MSLRFVTMTLALAVAIVAVPAVAATAEAVVPAAAKVGCASPEAAAAANPAAQPAGYVHGPGCAHDAAALPKVVFKLNTAEDAPTILRFVTNYLAVAPNARVAVVGYAGGIDFMLEGAGDANGKLYADQIAALTDRGVAFKVCNNTLKARNLRPPP